MIIIYFIKIKDYNTKYSPMWFYKQISIDYYLNENQNWKLQIDHCANVKSRQAAAAV